ncbi:AAA family ATPase [Candidatus Nanopelagicales bacterium]|nr:AAA family ATPase [Candidatus Nanopelagicales bacterium]
MNETSEMGEDAELIDARNAAQDATSVPVPVPIPPVPERGTQPKYADVAELLANGIPQPPSPDYLAREDGHRLFYRGTVNILFGDPESGKSWVALAACQEALSQDGNVLFIDSDHNGVGTIVSRLISLGAPRAALADLTRFRYIAPDDSHEMEAVVVDAKQHPPDVAVVDSVGEIIPMFGGSSNSPDDYTRVNRQVMRPIADTGACVVLVDHLAKNTASRDFGPTGTAAKRRTFDGVSLRVVLREPFTPGHGGCCALSVNKDRHGGVRAHCPTVSGSVPAGLFRLTQRGERLSWTVSEPSESDAVAAEPRRYATESDADALKRLDPPPSSVRDIKVRMGWGGTRATDAWAAFRVPTHRGAERGTGVPRPFRERSGNRGTGMPGVSRTLERCTRNRCPPNLRGRIVRARVRGHAQTPTRHAQNPATRNQVGEES